MIKKRIVIYLGVAVTIVGLASLSIRYKFNADEQYRSYIELEKRYANAMAQDSYGGKTPKETFSLFIAALKMEDVELASKYFMLDANLSQDKWLKTLTIFKEQKLLDEIVHDIERDHTLLELKLNEYSGVWKIVNFK